MSRIDLLLAALSLAGTHDAAPRLTSSDHFLMQGDNAWPL